MHFTRCECQHMCPCVADCGVHVYLSITWSSDLWWAASVGVGGRQSGRAQKGRHRIEKEDISLELVTVGRGWAPIQLAWRLYQGMCVTGGLGGAIIALLPAQAKQRGLEMWSASWRVLWYFYSTMACVFISSNGDHVAPHALWMFWHLCCIIWAKVCLCICRIHFKWNKQYIF